MRILISFIFFAGLVLSGCLFGAAEPPGNIRGYNKGVVDLKVGSYRVGVLADNWTREESPEKALIFREKTTRSTIATDALCGENFDDASLEILSRHLIMGIDDLTMGTREKRMLADREALSTLWTGKLDGVAVSLQTVVLKKNTCLFDFYYIASPSDFAVSKADFEKFVNGFSYP